MIDISKSDLINAKIHQGIGYISLNRPSALNALNREMVDELHHLLESWACSSEVDVVVLNSTSPTFFCSGGDIKDLYHHFQKQDWAKIQSFYTQEYALNKKLSCFPKPTIAIGAGLVMGGGFGLARHCDYRIVTETSSWAMPETAIGFFPDVGAAWFLNQCPGFTGWLMALSGCRVNAEDLLYTGLGTHHLASRSLDFFYEGLEKAPTNVDAQGCIDILLENLQTPTQLESPLAHFRQEIDAFLAEGDLEILLSSFDMLLLQKLKPAEKEWLQNIYDLFAYASPLSLEVTHLYLEKKKSASLENVFDCDLKLAKVFLEQGDFIEGVRAKLIDRDGQPNWKYSDLFDVNQAAIKPFIDSF